MSPGSSETAEINLVDETLIGPPNIGLKYEITVLNKDGSIASHQEHDAKCFVQNFLRLVYAFYLWGVPTDIRAPFRLLNGTLSTSRGQFDTTVGCFLCNAGLGILTRGIVAGSGNNATVADSYALQTPISHGTTDGTLQYSVESILPLQIDGNKITFATSRSIVNSGATSITVREIALYCLGGDSVTVMIMRDVLPSEVPLSTGQSAIIVYKIILNG